MKVRKCDKAFVCVVAFVIRDVVLLRAGEDEVIYVVLLDERCFCISRLSLEVCYSWQVRYSIARVPVLCKLHTTNFRS